MADKTITFCFRMPDVRQVRLIGDFDGKTCDDDRENRLDDDGR